MNYLFVVAHPDDEVLGEGATINKLIKEGNEVTVCILSDNSKTRFDNLKDKLYKSHKILGIKNTIIGDFRCLNFKDEPHQEMVQFIEESIRISKPDIVFTHTPSDINPDHEATALSCIEAVRLPQRLLDYNKPIKELLYMEVKSSTDWQLNRTVQEFLPNTYNEVSKEDMEKKIAALKVYDGVVRDDPHPRAENVINALAVVRGSESGYKYAEAFQSVFKLGV